MVSGSQGKGGDCQGAVLRIIDLFSIIFVELVMQNVGFQNSNGTHTCKKISRGWLFITLRGTGHFAGGGRGGGSIFKVLIGFGESFPDKSFMVGQFIIHESRTVMGKNVTSINSKHQSYLHDCREGMLSTSEPSLACRRYFFLLFKQEIF